MYAPPPRLRLSLQEYLARGSPDPGSVRGGSRVCMVHDVHGRVVHPASRRCASSWSATCSAAIASAKGCVLGRYFPQNRDPYIHTKSRPRKDAFSVLTGSVRGGSRVSVVRDALGGDHVREGVRFRPCPVNPHTATTATRRVFSA